MNKDIDIPDDLPEFLKKARGLPRLPQKPPPQFGTRRFRLKGGFKYCRDGTMAKLSYIEYSPDSTGVRVFDDGYRDSFGENKDISDALERVRRGMWEEIPAEVVVRRFIHTDPGGFAPGTYAEWDGSQCWMVKVDGTRELGPSYFSRENIQNFVINGFWKEIP